MTALTIRLLLSAAPLLLFLSPAPGPAAGSARRLPDRAPEREVRAVWITTVAGLDWPRTTDPAGQKASLLSMVETLSASGFNTIFFQVRGRGDALYRSELEPWSEVLTGTPGGDPGWDPLAFLLAEAHRRGMEVHAWFNTYLVKGGEGGPFPEQAAPRPGGSSGVGEALRGPLVARSRGAGGGELPPRGGGRSRQPVRYRRPSPRLPQVPRQKL